MPTRKNKKTIAKPAPMKKIVYINELVNLARQRDDYKKLLFDTSANLGGWGDKTTDIDAAARWLNTNAMAVADNDNVECSLRQHARELALSVADRGYVLDVGKIALSGTSEELLASEKVQEAYLGKKH